MSAKIDITTRRTVTIKEAALIAREIHERLKREIEAGLQAEADYQAELNACSECADKDARIAELETENERLRAQIEAIKKFDPLYEDWNDPIMDVYDEDAPP